MSKIEGQTNLIRDDENMSIINTNTGELHKARARKARQIKQTSDKDIITKLNLKVSHPFPSLIHPILISKSKR